MTQYYYYTNLITITITITPCLPSVNLMICTYDIFYDWWRSCTISYPFGTLPDGIGAYRYISAITSCDSVNREPIQQLCKPRTHTTTLSTENPYNNSVNREPIQQLCKLYRVVVWVLGLQSLCMGSRFTELLENTYNNSENRGPIQQLCKQRTHTQTL
jgi:hypothetical protein